MACGYDGKIVDRRAFGFLEVALARLLDRAGPLLRLTRRAGRCFVQCGGRRASA
jgi:hypothetical protein